MKRLKLSIGTSDFRNLRQSGAYFVDKSLFIKEVIESSGEILLLPRPRRFGKTMNLSMLRYFFDISEPENRGLFRGLKVWEDEETMKHCCSYPVIFMTFKDVKASDWKRTLNYMKLELSNLFKQFRYLLEGSTLYSDEKQVLTNYITTQADEEEYALSLKLLSEWLYRYHNERVVILIDEYDTPIHSAYGRFYEETVTFMRNLLSGAFKDNSYLYKGVITGILRVSKESIFSGLNNLSVFSILNNRFSDKFGFTEEEVKQILKDFEIDTDYEKVKEWYNGYRFGDTEGIYNPWSILNYVSEHRDGFRSYWSQTSSNALIREQITNRNAEDVRRDILRLLEDETVIKTIEELLINKLIFNI
jgi:hypothetical protein